MSDKTDRDLLIEIHTDVKAIKQDVGDHEKRLRFLERIAYTLSGAWGLLAGWFGIHVSKH